MSDKPSIDGDAVKRSSTINIIMKEKKWYSKIPWLKLFLFLFVMLIVAYLSIGLVANITRPTRLATLAESEANRLVVKYNSLVTGFNGLKDEYGLVVNDFNEAIKRTSIAYINIGSVESNKAITVKIRPYDNLSETTVVPTLYKPSSDRTLCYQLNGTVCDSFLNNTLSQDECYLCEPIPRLSDPDGSMTMINNNVDALSDRTLIVIGSIYQGRIFVSSLKLQNGGAIETYTIDELPVQMGILGQPTTFPAVIVDNLLPDTIYTIVVNEAGLFDLLPMPAGDQAPLPVERPKRTTFEEKVKLLIEEAKDETRRESTSFLDNDIFRWW